MKTKEQKRIDAEIRQEEFNRMDAANKEARQTGKAVGKYSK